MLQENATNPILSWMADLYTTWRRKKFRCIDYPRKMHSWSPCLIYNVNLVVNYYSRILSHQRWGFSFQHWVQDGLNRKSVKSEITWTFFDTIILGWVRNSTMTTWLTLAKWNHRSHQWKNNYLWDYGSRCQWPRPIRFWHRPSKARLSTGPGQRDCK